MTNKTHVICETRGNLYPTYCTQYNEDGSEIDLIVCDKCLQTNKDTKKEISAIDKALEELKPILKGAGQGFFYDDEIDLKILWALLKKTKNLVNALEAERADIKIQEEVNNETTF